MEKIKIGILTCSNTARTLDCPLSPCLKDMYNRKGLFKKYTGKEIELTGISTCNGCPTINGEEIILPKVESLIHYGATHIHLSYCMITLCPFKNKYVTAIRNIFKDVELITGTHEPHQTSDKFRCDVMNMLKERRKTIIP